MHELVVDTFNACAEEFLEVFEVNTNFQDMVCEEHGRVESAEWWVWSPSTWNTEVKHLRYKFESAREKFTEEIFDKVDIATILFDYVKYLCCYRTHCNGWRNSDWMEVMEYALWLNAVPESHPGREGYCATWQTLRNYTLRAHLESSAQRSTQSSLPRPSHSRMVTNTAEAPAVAPAGAMMVVMGQGNRPLAVIPFDPSVHMPHQHPLLNPQFFETVELFHSPNENEGENAEYDEDEDEDENEEEDYVEFMEQ